MRVIHKFPLQFGINRFKMPAFARITHFDFQNDMPMVWALVDQGREQTERSIYVAVTGEPITFNDFEISNIRTAITPGGNFVAHCIELSR